MLLGLLVSIFAEGVEPNYIYLAISGIVIAIISQAGDLIMSVIKRHYGIKDFSNILPGHGGVLDRVDSILAVSIGIELMIMLTYITNISIF